jgi:hypothetical protein
MRCCSSNSRAWSVFVCISSLCVIGVIDFVHRSVNGLPRPSQFVLPCPHARMTMKKKVTGAGGRDPPLGRHAAPSPRLTAAAPLRRRVSPPAVLRTRILSTESVPTLAKPPANSKAWLLERTLWRTVSAPLFRIPAGTPRLADGGGPGTARRIDGASLQPNPFTNWCKYYSRGTSASRSPASKRLS